MSSTPQNDGDAIQVPEIKSVYKQIWLRECIFLIRKAKVYVLLSQTGSKWDIRNYMVRRDEHIRLNDIYAMRDEDALVIERLIITERRQKLKEGERWFELSELGDVEFIDDEFQEQCHRLIKLFCEKFSEMQEKDDGLINSLKAHYGDYKTDEYFTRQYMTAFYEYQKRSDKNRWLVMVDEIIENDGAWPFMIMDAWYEKANIEEMRKEKETLAVFEREYPKIDYKNKRWWKAWGLDLVPEFWAIKCHFVQHRKI